MRACRAKAIIMTYMKGVYDTRREAGREINTECVRGYPARGTELENAAVCVAYSRQTHTRLFNFTESHAHTRTHARPVILKTSLFGVI